MSQDDWIRLLSTDQRFAGHRCHDLAWFSARWLRFTGQVGFAPEMYKNVVIESGSGDLASGRAFSCLTPEVEPAVRRYRTKQPAQNVLKTIFYREVNTLPWTSHTAKAPRHRRSCRFTSHIPHTPRRRPTRSTTCCSATTRQPSWHVRERSQRRGRHSCICLAYQQLRHDGQSVPSRQLLGVIIEVPLAGGLDTLAAYSEGGVRYINHSGRIAVVDGAPSMAPPERDNVRLTFLVSDGLYFGEGPMTVMQREPMAAPVIQRATELLQAVVATGAT